MAKINEDLKNRAKEFVLDAYNIYKNRSGLEDNWQKWDKIYNNIPYEKFYEGVANLNPPETRKACDTIVNFMDEILFGGNPLFRLEPIGGNNDKKKAEINEKIIKVQLEKVRFRAKMREYLRNFAKYGFGIAKVPFVYKDKYIIQDKKERSKLNKAISNILKLKAIDEDFDTINKKEQSVYDNIDFKCMDPFNFFWDYYSLWENQTCLIERILNVSETHLKLQEQKGIYHGITKILEENSYNNSSSNSEGTITDKYPHYSEITGLSDNYGTNKKLHEILEAWCNFDIDGDGIDEECVITILDGQHVIRIETNPYDIQEKPFVFCYFNYLEGTSLGVGIPQLCERSQIALNDFANQSMDNITSILNNMWIIDEASEVPDEQLKSKPNGIIRSANGVDAIRPLAHENTSNEAFKAMALMKDDIRQISGATVNLQGMPARYDTTATEIQAQTNSSTRDILSKIRDIEDLVIKPILRKLYSYNIQYMSRNDLIKILGIEAARPVLDSKENSDLSEILKQDYDFVPLGTTQIENKIVQRQQILNFTNIANGINPNNPIVDMRKLIKILWQNMGTGNDDILYPDEEQKEVMPNDENLVMAQGEIVFPTINDNHLLHLQVHSQFLQNSPYLEQLMMPHIQIHQNILQQQELSMKQNSMQQNNSVVPTQEQPNFTPEQITEKNAGQVQGLVTPSGGM